MEAQNFSCVNGGDGETSYARNSSLQRDIMAAARSIVKEAALDLYCAASFPEKLSVADLGCSSGPNALSVVTDVVDTIEGRCRQLGRPPPEFQLFLNDLPGNDFNSVFRSLRTFYEEREASGRGRELGRCFFAGVPGSFYGRLFQSRSIHFFHSSTSLHWLSQGYIAEEKVDSFNLPYYAPCAMEVEREIQREGSFSLEHLEIFEVDWGASQDHDNHTKHSDILSDTARSQANCIRAVTQSMLVSHFGGDIIEDLFLRYSKVLEGYLSMNENKVTNLVISLLRES